MSDTFTIDPTTLFDNSDARTVEFSGEIDGERRDFAIQYDALEALDGAAPGKGAVAAFERHQDAVARAAAVALARDTDQNAVMISENDLV